MANERPDLRFQPNVNIEGIAQLIAQKPVQEEQIRQSRDQQKRQKQQQLFQNVMQAAQLGSTFAEQASLKAQRRQAMTLTQEISDISQALASGQQVEALGGTPAIPTEDLQGQLQGSLLEAGVPSALKAATALAFPGVETQERAGVSQKINILKPDGTVELGFFDPKQNKFFLGSGEEAPAGSRQAFSEGSRTRFFTDAKTGERVKENLVTGEITVAKAPGDFQQVRSIDELTIVEEGQIDKQVVRFDTDKRKVLSQLALDQIDGLKAIFDLDIGAATEPLKSLIARTIAGEKGVLTDRDVLRNSGNQALGARLKQLLVKWKSGKFSANNRREFRKIIGAAQQNSNKKLQERVDSFRGAISRRFNLSPEEVEETLLLPTIKSKKQDLNTVAPAPTGTFRIGIPEKSGSLTIKRIK